MSTIVKNAIAEKYRLEKELAQNPIFNQIKLLDDIIATFGNNVSTKGTKPTKKDQIHKLAKDCIKSAGGHAKLATVHEYLQKHGVKVHIGMLKSYMYKYSDLKASRDKGFSIKK